MNIKQRHKETDRALNKAAQRVINSRSLRRWAQVAGDKHGFTGQTIINYLYGMGKDGFLKEALIEDLQAG